MLQKTTTIFYKPRLFFISFIFITSLIPVSFWLPSGQVYNALHGFLLTNKIILFCNLIMVAYLLKLPQVQFVCQKVIYVGSTINRRAFLTALFVLFLLPCIATSYRVFHFYPTIIDSIAQYIQAKFLANGTVSFPLHPLQSFFSLEHFIEDGKFYSQYPPGHVLLLALGHLTGAPWLVNPLLGAATCIALYLLAEEIFNEKIARLTGVLCITSPFLRDISSEYMNHATAFFFVTLFTLFFVKGTKSGNVTHGLLAGISIGYAFITRPYTALAYSLPIAGYGLWLFYKNPKHLLKCYFSILLGFLPIALIQGFYNYATTGDPLLYGYIKLYGANHLPGFHAIPDHFVGQMQGNKHTLWRGIEMSFDSLNGLQIFLFCWPIPSLLFAALACILHRPKTARYMYLFLAISVSVWLSNMFYFYNDWCFGPRYLYEISGLAIILTAYGLTQVPLLCRLGFGIRCRAKLFNQYAMCFLGAGAITTALYGSYPIINSEYCWASTPLIPQFQEEPLHHALVFIHAGERQYQQLAAYYYPIKDSNNVIIAHDMRDKENQELMNYYPDRSVYRWIYSEDFVDHSQLGWFFLDYHNSNIIKQLQLIRTPIAEIPTK